MKIVYLSNSVLPSEEANAVHVMKMCQAFGRAGHETTLMVRAGDHSIPTSIFESYSVEPVFKIIPYTEGPRNRLTRYLTGLRMAIKSRQLNADLAYGRNLQACFFAVLLGIRTGFELHRPIPSGSRADRLLLNKLVNHQNFTKLVVISSALFDHLASESVPAHKMAILHDGADPLVQSEETEALKGSFRAGYIGQLYPGKGMELISQLAALRPETTFHVIGGSDNDLVFWKKETAALSNIVFHGYKSQKQISRIRKEFHVLLAPYQSKVTMKGGEGDLARWMSPLKVFEYMATGTPIVVSDLPVLHEILEHRKTALFCSPHNAYEWSEALSWIKSNPSEASAIGLEAKDHFVNSYTWSKRVENLLPIIGQQ